MHHHHHHHKSEPEPRPEPSEISLALIEVPIYTNMVTVSHTDHEFYFDFGCAVPHTPESGPHTRLVMSPRYAKQLLEALAKNLAIFEKHYGEVG